MAPLFLPYLVNSLARQLSHVTRYTAGNSFSVAGARRCISIFSTAVTQARVPWSLAQDLHGTVRPLLLGNCEQLMGAQPSVGMKTKTALKRRCKDCFFVRRRGRLFVYCKTHPRHKQRQG
uniref:Ribosomal protein n=2 Tax=Electrophorus electricus TaxID=8005 RepID=A0A4W4GNB3_ELEEL